MKKKAQIEIIGLMLIIILLTILAVVFLRLTLKPSRTITEARQSIIAKAAIDSIIKTSYNEETFEDLIYGCYSGYTDYNCELLTKEINQIMPKLMPKKPFTLTFASNEQEFLKITSKTCNLGVQANNNYVINSIPIQISLKLC